MTASPMDLEDLLLSTLDAVSRFRVGQREAVGAALDAGDLLTTAKARLPHGGWAEWLDRLGLRAEPEETKAAYYAALTARHRALRALTQELATTEPVTPVYSDAQGNEHAEV